MRTDGMDFHAVILVAQRLCKWQRRDCADSSASARSCRLTADPLPSYPHIEGFGTNVPIFGQEVHMEDDIWERLHYVTDE